MLMRGVVSGSDVFAEVARLLVEGVGGAICEFQACGREAIVGCGLVWRGVYGKRLEARCEVCLAMGEDVADLVCIAMMACELEMFKDVLVGDQEARCRRRSGDRRAWCRGGWLDHGSCSAFEGGRAGMVEEREDEAEAEEICVLAKNPREVCVRDRLHTAAEAEGSSASIGDRLHSKPDLPISLRLTATRRKFDTLQRGVECETRAQFVQPCDTLRWPTSIADPSAWQWSAFKRDARRDPSRMRAGMHAWRERGEGTLGKPARPAGQETGGSEPASTRSIVRPLRRLRVVAQGSSRSLVICATARRSAFFPVWAKRSPRPLLLAC